MALLPENIVDRLIQMERRIQALSTAVNTRPPLNEIRPTTPSSPAKPVLRVFDGYNHELFADDIATGGLARPWLQLMPPVDHQNVAKWPSTTSTTFTPIAQSFNPVWQPKMRLMMYTRASSGAAGQVKVMVDGQQFGPTVPAGTSFDHTGLLPVDLPTKFGKVMTVEIHAVVTSASGTVYAQTVSMYGTQT
ncbi:hypothetical protein GCM10010222_08730 [Streptomyces tanashiensis]|uniref:hypothetical protein n=1 Tax=Streptomyces tanashiensis TaxID=67367 RepID=UPI00167B14CD|nr:hypothetical protein [Streptomyces tanashiensis]GGS70099.1 hypothetical protein GCM10010222_08730 [Streptomyces tanashiensis]